MVTKQKASTSSIQVGFEVEFTHFHTQNSIQKQLRGIFSGFPWMRYSRRWKNPIRARGCFSVTKDCSVKGDTKGYKDHELILPMLELSEGLECLEKTFTWMSLIGAEVNNSCGLHVNLSFEKRYLMKHLDKVKLILLTDEKRWLKVFGRSHNVDNCELHLKGLRKDLKRFSSEYDISMNTLVELCDENLDCEDRGRTINFSHFEDGYLEFRMIGNRDYHKRFLEIKEAIQHFSWAMQSSISNADRKEYVDRLQVLAA